MLLSDQMLAISIENSVLKPSRLAIPIPSANQVLIKVVAAGINRPDIMQRKGLYPPPSGASEIPGLEVAGTIAALGDNIQHLNTGDPVCALITGGGYAEYCLASAALCLPVPENLSFIQAAALPECFFTVWNTVFDLAQIQAGETVLIHGGTSGIGTTAIQLATAFNTRVMITAGSTKKCEFCLQLGAAAAINYKTQDFVEQIKQLTDNQGVDVILDMIGGDYFPRNLKCLANDGRLVQIALQNGLKSEINLLPVMLKRLTITGSTLRARNDAFKSAIARQLLEKVWPLLISGKITPVINETFPLTEAAKAHQLMESSLHIGKIILTV